MHFSLDYRTGVSSRTLGQRPYNPCHPCSKQILRVLCPRLSVFKDEVSIDAELGVETLGKGH